VPLARYFHLKNMRPAADGAGPMPPGGSLEAGVLDYRSILAAAFDAGYAGPLTIEFLSFEPKPLEEKLAGDARFVRAVLAELHRA
jgi:sugar phosphate isomerase/epimerase